MGTDILLPGMAVLTPRGEGVVADRAEYWVDDIVDDAYCDVQEIHKMGHDGCRCRLVEKVSKWYCHVWVRGRWLSFPSESVVPMSRVKAEKDRA
jgi:hypothetical protein